MHSSPSSSSSTTIIIFVSIIISTCYSQYDEKYYEYCVSNFTCGENIQNIRYPFWGGSRPQFCGQPAFELKCQSNEFPTIDIKGRPFHVLGINQSNHVMTIAGLDLWNDYCTQELHNITVDSSMVRLGPMNWVLSIFYNCTLEITRALPNTFTCERGGIESLGFYASGSFVSVDQIENSRLRLSTISCNESVEVPVPRATLDELSNGSLKLQEGLQRGFEVIYNAKNEACSMCEGLGGLCGSNSSGPEFVCHCRDRTDPSTCQNPGKRRNKMLITIAIAIGTASLVTCVFLIVWFKKKRSSYTTSFFWWKSTTSNDSVEAFLNNNGSLTPKRYCYSEIKKVTNCFREKLGQGGYGGVYKGKLLDGRLVAVKLLNETNGNGEGEEFINEVASISRTSHVNVVTLLGYCFEGRKRALVYEFMENGSLEKVIPSKKHHESNKILEWNTRHKIAIGVARGLEYLHRGCGTSILHFDIKPHNILLDEDFCPKISDFGLAKLCNKKESTVSLLYGRGTVGYIAPEVFSRQFGRVTHKADVFSYGMLIVEMVGLWEDSDECVREVSSEIYFPHFIYKKIESDADLGLRDIKSVEDEVLARKMILVGLWCIQTRPSDRPTISKVIEMLEGNLGSLQVPREPLLSPPLISIVASSSSQISEENESCRIE